MTTIKGNMYGVFRKVYEQPTEDTIRQIMSELKAELSSALDNNERYDIEAINKHYYENEFTPVWTIALKATQKWGEAK